MSQINLDFVDSIEYRKQKKFSDSSKRTYYTHYFIFRGNFPTVTVSANSFLSFDIENIKIKEGQKSVPPII